MILACCRSGEKLRCTFVRVYKLRIRRKRTIPPTKNHSQLDATLLHQAVRDVADLLGELRKQYWRVIRQFEGQGDQIEWVQLGGRMPLKKAAVSTTLWDKLLWGHLDIVS
jgi:hypothetical protein